MTIKATFRHIEVSQSDVSLVAAFQNLSQMDDRGLPVKWEIDGTAGDSYQFLTKEIDGIIVGMFVRKSKNNIVDTLDEMLTRHHYKLEIGTLYSFNFFALSKKTHHGIYHEQPDGAPLSKLSAILRMKGDEMLNKIRQEHVAELKRNDKNISTEEAEKQAIKKFKRSIRVNPVYTEAEFRDIVSALSGVTAFKHRMRVVQVPDGALSVKPKTEWRTFKYGNSGLVKGLGSSVASFIIERTRSDRATVTGVEATGEKVTVHYGRKTREMITSMNADAFKKMWPLKSVDFATSAAVSQMVKIMKKHKARFGLSAGMDSDADGQGDDHE